MLRTGQDKPYSVYGPWFKKWVSVVEENEDLLRESDDPQANDDSIHEDKVLSKLFDEDIPTVVSDMMNDIWESVWRCRLCCDGGCAAECCDRHVMGQLHFCRGSHCVLYIAQLLTPSYNLIHDIDTCQVEGFECKDADKMKEYWPSGFHSAEQALDRFIEGKRREDDDGGAAKTSKTAAKPANPFEASKPKSCTVMMTS